MGKNEESGKKVKKRHKKLDDIIETDRQETNNCIRENQKAQDQMIFTVSAAFFALMPFLLDKLQIIPYFGLLTVLLLLSNAVALISTLLSFYFCREGTQEDFELRKQYIHCLKENPAEASKNCCNNKPARSCKVATGKTCNTVSWASMIATTIFVFLMLLLYLSKQGD